MQKTDPTPDTPEKTAAQAVMFANRLEKQYKHLGKWARRTGVSCFRLYDKDIPEVPLAVDLYTEKTTHEKHLHIALYERPYDKSEEAEEEWMRSMREAASDILSIPVANVHSKIRRRQRGEDSQYEKVASSGKRIHIDELGSTFLVNLDDYLDTGLFLDHRPARSMVRSAASGKRVLNLFCYTGAFSVHAASGGAVAVTSVDLSKTYLAWANANMELNGFHCAERAPFELVHADVKAFLASAKREGTRWDLIVCDPPTFSNSKRAVESLDINRDWSELCRSCLALLSPGGILYFSTNSRQLKFDPDLIGGALAREGSRIEDLSIASIPEDFRNKNIHRLWKLSV